MKVNLINDNIYHFIADTQYELTSAFVRIAEFYESPFDEIRGSYFTLDRYMDLYAEHNDGVFSYFQDWGGFNIPGDSLIQFYDIFKNYAPRAKEETIFSVFEHHIENRDVDFYVIGSIGQDIDTLRHEYAHAQYYLDDVYRIECNDIYDTIDPATEQLLRESLLDVGYTESKIKDEVQAYLSTSPVIDLLDNFKFMKNAFPLNIITAYQSNFYKLVPEMHTKPL